jgi:hypothetical protein
LPGSSPPKAVASANVVVRSFDGYIENVEFLRSIFGKLFLDAAASVNLTFVNAVLAPRAGKATFTRPQGFCYEGGRVVTRGRSVRAATLDDELSDLSSVHLLHSATEHYSAFVASGAQRTLVNKVGLYIFDLIELHPGMLSRGYLKKHVQELDGMGFRCYYPLASQKDATLTRSVVRMNGPCWVSRYAQEVGWKHLLCANVQKFPELAVVFDELERTVADVATFLTKCPKINVPSMYPGKDWGWFLESEEEQREVVEE